MFLLQDKLVRKNFNIVKEANGTNKIVKKVFPHIPVSDSLEIRFYYAGKGSTGIPVRGTYGPLVSAISVQSGKSSFAESSHPHSFSGFLFVPTVK